VIEFYSLNRIIFILSNLLIQNVLFSYINFVKLIKVVYLPNLFMEISVNN